MKKLNYFSVCTLVAVLGLAFTAPSEAFNHKKGGGKGGKKGMMGSYVWLHLAPEATGLPIHIFARYQHLDAPSPLTIGQTVKAGAPVGPGGATGTTGGHFGSAGYSHLHLVFYTGESAEFTAKGPMLGPDTLNYLDPMGLYLAPAKAVTTNHALRDLPSAHKSVPVGVRTLGGETLPKDAKAVWPVACK